MTPQRGERKLAGGERSEPPCRRGTTIRTPAGLQELPAPLPGRIRLLQYSGGSLRSPPAKLPTPFQGARASGNCVTVFNRIYEIAYLANPGPVRYGNSLVLGSKTIPALCRNDSFMGLASDPSNRCSD